MVYRNPHEAYLVEVGLAQILTDHETLSIICHVKNHIDFPRMTNWPFWATRGLGNATVTGLQSRVWIGPKIWKLKGGGDHIHPKCPFRSHRVDKSKGSEWGNWAGTHPGPSQRLGWAGLTAYRINVLITDLGPQAESRARGDSELKLPRPAQVQKRKRGTACQLRPRVR